MKPVVTRTLGPLHLEDLEPHRFEDLVRQLAYDFRDWERLEATGRAGADEGFDARGLERVPALEQSNTRALDGYDDEDAAPVATRQWVIQCKREREIGPKQLAKYVEALPAEDIYGVVLAAACDFSKKARNAFFDGCRARGYSEAHLWGKGEIEDALFQPKNDHLLFAYFGISLRSRRRSEQTELRSWLAMKRRLRKLLSDSGPSGMIVMRDAAGSTYPDDPGAPNRASSSWFIVPKASLRHDGLEVEYREFHAYVADDQKSWDAANARGLHRVWYYVGQWPRDQAEDPRNAEVDKMWEAWPYKNRAWLYVYARIPFERVLAIDDSGDQFFMGPQIYLEYVNGSPFDAAYGYVENIEPHKPIRIDPTEANRIEVFPANSRRPLNG